MIEHYLEIEDDSSLWSEIISCLSQDVELMLCETKYEENIYLKIGACSHWVRPHQTRWTESGGFAWPSGYGGNEGRSRMGTPEYDWSCLYLWCAETSNWQPAKRQSGKKKITLRVAVPARTTRHDQAAIHTIWEQGTPNDLGRKTVRFYGFRKQEQVWSCVAHHEIKA